MKHRLPALDGLKVFESAARHLSFSSAASELCISKGAVSYQISKLEQQLACTLFKRSVRQVYLTEAGQLLLQTTRHCFGELDRTLVQLRDDNDQAAVTVATTTYVAARWLSSRIARFNERYPEVAVLLQHPVNPASFSLADFDIAVRWQRCDEIAHRDQLAQLTMPLYPVVSPQLLRRHGLDPAASLDPADWAAAVLLQLPLLDEDRQQDLWCEWFTSAGVDFSQITNPRRTISDANVRVQAAVDGQGLILADAMMQTEIDNGLLVAPFAAQLHGYGYALLAAPSRPTRPNAEALRQWLADEFGCM